MNVPADYLAQLPRSIAREPEYESAAPRYALFAFGARAETRVWAVLDRAHDSAEWTYDVLHLDLNANGDLTDPGERFAAESYGESLIKFDIGDFRDPKTGRVHKEWILLGPPVQEKKQAWNSRLASDGLHVMGVVYPKYGDSPKTAPIFHLDVEAPLVVRSWHRLPALSKDKPVDWAFNIGSEGFGPRSFATVNYRELIEFPLEVELVYKDLKGRRRRSTFELFERC